MMAPRLRGRGLVAYELTDELTKQDLFKDVPHRHLKNISPLIQVRDVRGGEELIREGTHSTEFFLIFSGAAALSVRGKRRDTRGPGEFFGEIAIVGHNQATTVTALEPMRVGIIEAKSFASLLETEPSLAVHLLEALLLKLEDLLSRPAGELR